MMIIKSSVYWKVGRNNPLTRWRKRHACAHNRSTQISTGINVTIKINFPFSNTALEGQSLTLAQKYSVVVPKVMDGSPLEYKLVRFLSNNNESLIPISYHNKSNFTGTVYYYDLKGRTEKLEGYNEGVLKAVSRDTGKSETSLAARAPKDCLPDDPYCDGGFFVYVPVQLFKDWYNIRDGGMEYSHSVYEGTRWESVFVPDRTNPPPSQGYHGHLDAPAPHGPGGSGHASNHPEEILVSKEFGINYPCQTGVVTEAVSSCTPLTRLVLDIFEQDNDVNLIFQSSNSINGNGQTSNTIKYNSSDKTCDVQVSFRESYLLSATDLSIARTAIHESLHAVLVYMLFEGKFATKTGNPEAGYEELVDGYIEYLKTNDPTRYGNEQHEVIANLNKDIATSLSAYGNKRGYSLPLSYYETLSWGGLIQTESFKKSYPKYLADGKLNPEWKTINNTLAAEQNNSGNYQDGNGKTIVPKGKPCK